MTILSDEAGRYELGFPYRGWPNEAAIVEANQVSEKPLTIEDFRRLKDGINPRWANDEDCARVLEVLGGRVPIYRSVYRFRKFDTAATTDTNPWGKPVRDSAIVDKLFFEFEHQACGVLCAHTMADVQRFIHWLRRNGAEPWILYSGGKSLHVYLLFNEVQLEMPHEAVKKVLKQVERTARLSYVDPAAMNGVMQVARTINAKNPKTGLYAIPIMAAELLNNTTGWILKLAQNPRRASWTPRRTDRFRDILIQADKELVRQKLIEELLPPLPKNDLPPGAMCENVERVYHAPADHEVRGHKGLLCLVGHCFNSGMGRGEAEAFCEEWNARSTKPMSRGYLRNQVYWYYANRPEYKPCLHVSRFVGRCTRCMDAVEPQ